MSYYTGVYAIPQSHTFISFLPYAGKPNNVGSNEASNFYVSGTDEYTKYLVRETSKYNKLKGTNISMDRYFTSVSVARWALDEQSISIVGTMRHDRKGIPKELKMLDGGEEKSEIYVYSEDASIMLVSYVDKKKSGKKIVLLTKMHDHVHVTKDEQCKPGSLVYDHTEGGVDVVDLVSKHNTTRTKHKRWPMNELAFVLDTVRTNVKTILQESVSQIKMSSFDFTYTLGKMLVFPHIERRYSSLNGLQSQLVNKMQRVLKVAESRCIEKALDNAKEGRCHICKVNIVGKPE